MTIPVGFIHVSHLPTLIMGYLGIKGGVPASHYSLELLSFFYEWEVISSFNESSQGVGRRSPDGISLLCFLFSIFLSVA